MTCIFVVHIRIENLSEEQVNSLKELWSILTKKIDEDNSSYKGINLKDEIFLTIGNEHPDLVLLRYLRARKWNIGEALKQFIGTVHWRHEWGLNKLMYQGESAIDKNEIRLGKTFYLGFDRLNRPINYIPSRVHIRGEYPIESTEKLTVFMMEVGRKLLHDPNESVTALIDLTGFQMRNMDYQNVKFLINVLQNHYPEFLGLALIVNAPRVFSSCWTIIKSWIDPVVRQKIRFVRNLTELNEFIPSNLLPKHLNGSKEDFQYDPPTEEEIRQINSIRKDFQGEGHRRDLHSKAKEHFIQSTRLWTKNQCSTEERNRSIEQLSSSFEQLIPYIHTKTSSHRMGLIQEPTFDLIYQQMQKEKH